MPKHSKRPTPQQRTHRNKLRQTTEIRYEAQTTAIAYPMDSSESISQNESTKNPPATRVNYDSKSPRRNTTATESTMSLLYNPLLYKELKVILILGSIVLSILVGLSFIVG